MITFDAMIHRRYSTRLKGYDYMNSNPILWQKDCYFDNVVPPDATTHGVENPCQQVV